MLYEPKPQQPYLNFSAFWLNNRKERNTPANNFSSRF